MRNSGKKSQNASLIKLYNFWKKRPPSGRQEDMALPEWQVLNNVYNLYVYKTVSAGTINPAQILSFKEFSRGSVGKPEPTGKRHTGEVLHVPDSTKRPIPNLEGNLDLLTEAVSVSELKTLLAVFDADAARRRLHPQRLLKVPNHLEVLEWRQKVVGLLGDIAALRTDSMPNLENGPTRTRYPAKIREGLARVAKTEPDFRFKRISVPHLTSRRPASRTTKPRSKGQILFETMGRAENLVFLTSLSRGTGGRFSGGSLLSKVTDLKAARIGILPDLSKDPTGPTAPIVKTAPTTAGSGTLLGGWAEVVAGWSTYFMLGTPSVRLLTARSQLQDRCPPRDLKLLLEGLNLNVRDAPTLPVTLPPNNHSRSMVVKEPRESGQLKTPEPPTKTIGSPPTAPTVEEAFLKTHGSVGEIFDQLGLLKHSSRTGYTEREAATAPAEYRSFSDSFKPTTFATLETSEVLRHERNQALRVLNNRSGSHHKITVPQQSPPEEVLQRIEQALIVHLGNNYLREVMYSHYGTWLPKYGVYAA